MMVSKKPPKLAAFYLKIFKSSLNMSFNTAINIAPKKPTATMANIAKAIRPRKLITITPELYFIKIITEKYPIE